MLLENETSILRTDLRTPNVGNNKKCLDKRPLNKMKKILIHKSYAVNFRSMLTNFCCFTGYQEDLRFYVNINLIEDLKYMTWFKD